MLTVLMATYNGAQTLPDVLDAFCQLEEPVGGWYMLVVDNASTDETQNIVQSYTQRLPLTVCYEPVRGKNIALNSSLDNIVGDLVVFIDDDVLPQPDWLVKMRVAADTHPSISIFGGVVLPKWKMPPESWLRSLEWPYMGISFALTPPTLSEGPIESDYIFGPNMAVRSDIFKAGHRFDVTIGPGGSVSYPMGGETEFIARMARQGYKLWYCPQSVVYHIIRPYQMDQDWILKRAIRMGRGKYRMWALHALNVPIFLRLPKFLIRQAIIGIQILRQAVCVAIARISGNPQKIFRVHWWWNYYIGKAVESYNMGVKRQTIQSP